MRALIFFLLGLLAGAMAFHAYYVGLPQPERCGWDHPFDQQARAACETGPSFKGYGDAARRQLDNLVDRVGG